MDTNNLVHMANRMGDFFQAMPDREEAQLGLADHIRKFWDPRMRKALVAHIENTGGTDLHPFVLQALTTHLTSWV
jgi:formate dehydrogenase subunit delta